MAVLTFFASLLHAQTGSAGTPLLKGAGQTASIPLEADSSNENVKMQDEYACAFTYPFFDKSAASPTALNPFGTQNNAQSLAKAVLCSEFGINSKDDFSAFIAENAKTNQLSSIYNASIMLVKKYPKTWPLAIIKREGLSAHEGTLLFFAHAMSASFPLQSITVYENARKIALYRLALAADFLAEDEARTSIEPCVETIKQSVHTWDEYFSLYAFGESFFITVKNGETKEELTLPVKLTERKEEAAQTAHTSIRETVITKETYESIVKNVSESAKNARDVCKTQNLPLAFDYAKKQESSIQDALYVPSEDALLFTLAQSLYARRFSLHKDDAEKVQELCAFYPDTPCLIFLRAMVHYNTHSYRKALSDCEAVLSKLKAAPKTCSLYREASFVGAISALLSTKPETALAILNALGAQTKKEDSALYLTARTNMALIGTSADYAKDAVYTQKAVDAFTALKARGFVLPKADSDWLKKVDTP